MYQPRPALPETGFVRLPQILSLIPISRSAWWAGIRAAPTRRRQAVFLCLSLSRSRPPEQAKKQTDGPQTRANARLPALNAQEGSREQREKNGGKRAWNGDFRRGVLKRTRPETAQTQGERAKKSQPDKGWDFTLWCWRLLNERRK